ncbi:MAG: tetratricopeptide repeat protein [Chloroflexi bacterium]|nr:tetratricopeptide repeat protein [Chloroflexota bacterium]
MFGKLWRRVTEGTKDDSVSIGIEELNKGEYTSALCCFDEAIRRDPSYSEAYSYRGAVYCLIGDYDRAVEDYNEAIELDPGAALFYSSRGGAYIHKGEFSRAMADLDKSLSLDSGNVEAYIARGHVYTENREFAKAAEDFHKAFDLDPDFVAGHFNSAYSSGIESDDSSSYSPDDIIRNIRQYKIVNGVSESVDVRRTQQGLPKAMGNSELGLAAWRVSHDLAGVDVDGQGHVEAEYGQRVKEVEYDGWTGIAYFREVWDMDTPDDIIISEMTDVLCRQIGNFAYEDFGLGITCGYPNDDQSLFGVFIAIGYGCSDGGAYTIARVNRVRESSGVPALEADYSLRSVARTYISLDTVPDDAQRLADLREAGYGKPGVRIRSFYSGAYSPAPEDTDQLTYEEVGGLAASGLLADHEETLLLSDWQDIGVAVRLTRHSETAPLCVHAEFVVGRQLPQEAERA